MMTDEIDMTATTTVALATEAESDAAAAATAAAVKSKFKFEYKLKAEVYDVVSKSHTIVYPFLSDNNVQDYILSTLLLVHAPYKATHGHMANVWKEFTAIANAEQAPDGTIPLFGIKTATIRARLAGYRELVLYWIAKNGTGLDNDKGDEVSYNDNGLGTLGHGKKIRDAIEGICEDILNDGKIKAREKEEELEKEYVERGQVTEITNVTRNLQMIQESKQAVKIEHEKRKLIEAKNEEKRLENDAKRLEIEEKRLEIEEKRLKIEEKQLGIQEQDSK
jgi:hypothetical protein